MTRKAIDCANYTTVPTPGEVACLIADGYELAIVGASYGTVARAQLEAFLAGGMAIEAYAWVSFKDGWEQPIDRALAVIDGLPVKRLWLDCEEDPGDTYTISRIAQAYGRVMLARPDLKDANAIGIYTGGWWWKPNTDDNTDFAAHPLWTADYRTPDANGPKLYGGWTKAAIWQFAGSVDICGLNADDNVILEEEGMTPEERVEFVQMQKDIEALKGYAWRDALRINALEFHKHQCPAAGPTQTSGPVQP